MFTITAKDIAALLPRPLDDFETERLGHLVTKATEVISTAFLREGRDFAQELKTVPWLEATAKEVVEEMVCAAILVGPNVGLTNASSTTGQVSDSVGFRDTLAWTSWSGLRLMDAQRELLGLVVSARATVRSLRPIPWPERRHRP